MMMTIIYIGIPNMMKFNNNNKLLSQNIYQSVHSSMNEDSDYESYLLYLPLYLYYTAINEPDMASKYLNLAYKIIEKELITEYSHHPDRDSYSKFYYCRDIIKTYNANIR